MMNSDNIKRQAPAAVEVFGDKEQQLKGGDGSAYGFICFNLGSQEYGVDLNHIKQIVQPPEITWVPRAKAHVLGVISIRGDVVTLVDARQVLGMEPASLGKLTRVLLMDVEGEVVGLLVDSVTQVRRIDFDEFEPNPALDETPRAEYVFGIARPANSAQITIIDLGGLLAEKIL